MFKFTEKECVKLREYCQKITNAPRPFESQPSKKIEGYAFCEDWEIIEILKCLFNGESYWTDPVPNRFKNNPLWEGREKMMAKALVLVENLKTVDAIIGHLDARRKNGSS